MGNDLDVYIFTNLKFYVFSSRNKHLKMYNNKVYSRHVQYNSSQMEYKNKIPKSDMSLKPR